MGIMKIWNSKKWLRNLTYWMMKGILAFELQVLTLQSQKN